MQQYKENKERLQRCVELNNLGIAYEKENNIDKAITAYEQNILLRYPASHSYNRLMVIYRKQKDYKNELRVIGLACSVFPKEEKYKKRKLKVREIINKQKK